MNKFIVITTINKKTKAIMEFEKFKDWQIILVGDLKSTPIKNRTNLTFLSVKDQRKLGFQICDKLPHNHYTRKNIGYLYAMREGADVIYDTDDDNTPYHHWELNDFSCTNRIDSKNEFINIYKYFTNEKAWPRGFPLNLIMRQGQIEVKKTEPYKVGVWQGLADLDPDVDAIYRLTLDKKITFENKQPVVLPVGKYCPFNSQNTFWSREAFLFLYLPATCSFRFTDILRGFIAQRLLWLVGLHLGFHKATVFQERNEHDYMTDFRDEIECYLNTMPVVAALNSLNFSESSIDNLLKVYKSLHNVGILSQAELIIVKAWTDDYKKLAG
jgi:hypothetical protein